MGRPDFVAGEGGEKKEALWWFAKKGAIPTFHSAIPSSKDKNIFAKFQGGEGQFRSKRNNPKERKGGVREEMAE